ncbi:MAG: replicative DNA helicase [Deinococcus sp.]|nr:replicative DNA helicase [Deinococcus sp.]
METRVPPQNLEAEVSLLGSVLLDPEAFGRIEGTIRAESFYKEGHRRIFEAVQHLAWRREPIDLVTLTNELNRVGKLEEAGGEAYLVGLVESVPSSANVEHYARIVAEKAALRDLISAAGQMTQLAYEGTEEFADILDRSERLVLEVSSQRRGHLFRSAHELVTESFQLIQQLYQQKEPITGIPTGFSGLDKLTAGLQPSSLNVIAARPSMGKTALALTIAQHVAIRVGKPVAIFSLEMAGLQLMMRMICSEARINMARIRGGHLAERDFSRLAEVAGKIAEAQFFIDDSPDLTVMEIRARSRRLMLEHSIALIVIDYLQLMSGATGASSENRQQEIANISRSLKALARELNVAIVVLSQLSRAVESRPSHRPMLSDLRESGAIEQDADLVMFIYRDEYYDSQSEKQGIAEVIVGKQRNGPTGIIELAFLEGYIRFENLAKEGT